MRKSRLDRLERALRPDPRSCYLLAIVDRENPEKSTYSYWDGMPGSGTRQITKAEFETLKENIPDITIINVTTIIDDIPKKAGRTNET
jgi:hypothetical protein